MIQQREPLYNKVLSDINNFTYQYNNIFDIPKQSNEMIKRQFYALNLQQVEQECAYPFSTWLLEKFQNNPPELIKIFSFLQWLKHPLQSALIGFEPLIHQISRKPNALLILKLLFLNIEPKHYQSEPHQPPYAITMISDEVFSFLIDNYCKYSASTHPLFWSLKRKQYDLLERILKIKPKWVDVQSDSGFTPLMLALQYKDEASLLSLLKFNPNHFLQNYQKETIAHVLCRTQDNDWIEKIITQPQFSTLNLTSMITNPELMDQNYLLPLNLALSEQMIPWMQKQLAISPHLRHHLYKSYTNAIIQNRYSDLALLYHALDLKFFEHPEILTKLLLKAIEAHRSEILNWLISLNDIHPEIYKAIKFFIEIERSTFHQIINLNKITIIEWDEVPAEICFSITLMLIHRNQIPKIVELRLFHLHHHFHTFHNPQNQITTNFIDILQNTYGIQIPRVFIDYFLDYLEENSSSYPGWLGHFHPDFIQLITKWGIPKNMLVQGSSLIHLIAQEDAKNGTTYLSKFINAEVHVNQFDKHGQHLFANLLRLHSKGFEQIKEFCKNFSQFSLQNLDARGSNLLHLAIEVNHIPCINWCITQNISILDTRLFDQQSSLELAFDVHNEDIFNILKKHLKKNQLIPLLNKLITQNNNNLIQYLLRSEQPFDWKFSSPQIQDLKDLNHPIIQAYLDKFHLKATANIQKIGTTVIETPKIKPEIISKPKNIHFTPAMFMDWVKGGNSKNFEKLLQVEYQTILETLFQNDFLIYLEMVFQSSCKPLNKIFIRIPAAIPKFEEHQAWLHLFGLAVTTDNSVIFENLICRQFILDHLQSNILNCKLISLREKNIKWFKLLDNHFLFSLEQERLLLQRVIENLDVVSLTKLLEIEVYQKHFIALPIEILANLLHKNKAFLDVLLHINKIEQYLLQIDHSILSAEQQLYLMNHVLSNLNPSSLTQLLKIEFYQNHLIQNAGEIPTEQQQLLLQVVIQNCDIDILAELLKIEFYQNHLFTLPIELINHLINQNQHIIRILLQFKPLEKLFILHAQNIVNVEQQQELLEHIIKAFDITALAQLLQIESFQNHFIALPIESMHTLIHQSHTTIEMLLQFKPIQQHIIKNAQNILLSSLDKPNQINIQYLLTIYRFRDQLTENIKLLIEKVIETNQMTKLYELWYRHFELYLYLRPYIPVTQLLLPEYIQSTFKFGFSGNQDLYIFGSAIHCLIEKTPLEYLNDIDFISSQPPPAGVYRQSKVQPQLYFTSLFFPPHRDIKLEYFVISHTPNHFIAEDFNQRDFTVNCLYCDREGKVFDPSGLGLTDLKQRLIRSIPPAATSFAQDPIRLLRTIRLILKGFRMLPDVSQAIENWVPIEDNMNYGHIYAMANEMLTSRNGHTAMVLLIKLNLLTRLLRFFPQHDHVNFDELKLFVNSEATRYKELTHSPIHKK